MLHFPQKQIASIPILCAIVTKIVSIAIPFRLEYSVSTTRPENDKNNLKNLIKMENNKQNRSVSPLTQEILGSYKVSVISQSRNVQNP